MPVVPRVEAGSPDANQVPTGSARRGSGVAGRLRRILPAVGAALIAFAWLLSPPAFAADLYLDPSGVNAGDCQTPTQPCSSVVYAQTQASATAEPDVVHLLAGVYTPDTNFLTVPGITWSGPQAGVPADEQTGDTASLLVAPGGFGFLVQADDIAFDGLTFRSANSAAADGSFGIYNLNPTTVRNSVFSHISTGIYGGASIVVSGVSLDTRNDAMYATGAQTTVTRTSFNPPTAYSGLISAGNGPITVTDSSFERGTYGFLTYAGSSTAILQRNRFSPSIPNGLYNDGMDADATDNWWGCNTGPNTPGCTTLTGPGEARTTTAPWLRLRASVATDPLEVGDTVTATGAIDRNSDDQPVTPSFPRSTVVFTASGGTLASAWAPLVAGVATTALTAPAAPTTVTVSATLDGQTAQAAVEVVDSQPTITADGDPVAARSGTVVAVSGTGRRGYPLQVTVNGVAAGLPVTVGSDGTWTSGITLGDGDNVLGVEQGLFTATGPTIVGVFAPPVTAPADGDRVRGTPTVTGTALPGAEVTVTDEDGTTIGTETVDACGCFSITVAALASGPQTLRVTQAIAQVTSAETTLAVTVTPIPTIDADRHEAMSGESVTLSGTGYPGSALLIRRGGAPIADATVDEHGAWTADVSLADGTNAFDVVQDGIEVSDPVEVEGRTAPGVLRPTPNAAVRPTFAIRGYGFAGVELTVTDEHGSEIGRTTPDACGCWSLRTTVPLADGPHMLTVRQTVGGTDRTSTVSVVVDPHALEVTSPGDLEPVRASDLRIVGAGAPGATIRIYAEPDDATPVASAVAEPDGSFEIPVTLPAGLTRIAVTQTPVGSTASDPVELDLILLLDPPTVSIPATTFAAGAPIEVTGTSRPDAQIVVLVNGESAGESQADASGRWILTLTAVAGENAISATQVDLSGNPAFSGASEPVLAVGVGAPTVTSPADAEHVQATFALTGTALPGATVTVVDGATTLATTTADATTGSWSASTTTPLTYGDRAIAVRQRLDGVTGADAERTVTVVPPAPDVTRPTGDEQGDGEIVVAGTADPWATVDVFVDGASLPTATTTADATGAFSTTAATTPGTHVVRVSQRVGGSLSGPLSTARSLVVLPPRPTLQRDSTATAAAGDAIALSGQALPGATVLIDREAPTGAVTTFTTQADATTGAWSRTIPAASRTNTITARQQVGGEIPPSGASAAVTVVATPRLAPPSVTLPGYAATGALTISGTAHPGASVTGTFGGQPVDATADDGGAWSASVTVAAGAQTVTFRQAAEVDGTDETSDPTAALTVTGVAAPTLTAPDRDAVVGASFAVTGTALPGATVTVRRGGDAVDTVTAGGDGTFTASVTLPAVGQYLVSAVQQIGSATSVASTVTVRFPPAAPTLEVSAAFVTGPVRMTGTALADAAIAVYEDAGSTPVATGTADAAGAYAITLTRPAGTYRYAVTQAVAGNESARSATRDVTVWGTALTIVADTPVVAVGDTASVAGDAVPGAVVAVSAAGLPVGTGTADGNGRWSARVTLPGGRHALTAAQRVGADVGEPVDGPTVTVLPAPTIATPTGPVDPTVTLSGSALAAVTIVIVDGTGRTLGSTVSDGDGAWSLTTTAPLAPGAHTLAAYARLGGVDGPRSADLVVTVRAVPVPPVEDPSPPPADGGSPVAPPTTPTRTTPPVGAVGAFTIAKPVVARRSTVRLALTLPSAGRVAVTVRARIAGKRIVYARAKVTVRTPGVRRIVLQPSRAATAALRRQKSAKVAITVTFTAPDGRQTTRKATATVLGRR